ncbi:MAG: amidohydrolase [Phaeodactylibacter sp.]|uniref:M20 metallopeptidase family protein n=1 Tax=Phaeodactylibacter sp. TaxID=1940289 RepID=UPI0032EC523A
MMKHLILTSLILGSAMALSAQNALDALIQEARDDHAHLSRTNDPYAGLKAAVQEDYPYLQDLYQHYHLHPELSFHEKETSGRMASELQQLGFEVTEKVGGYGVVGVLRNGEGPTVLVRADMDALPIVEDTGLPYASTVTTKDDAGNEVGVMHACGHDVHMTVWTGAARQLAERKDQWSGTLVFIGQPAEERGGGAKAMLADGLYERFPKPDYAIALHVNAGMEAGKVGCRSGYSLANVDMMDITVYGQGGHGAYPHTTKDPVLLASRIVVALQTVVSRELSPLEPAVVTVGSIHGGTKGNVIPNEVGLELTLRSYTDEVRAAIIEKINRICKGVALSAGLEESQYPKVELRDEFTPATYNDPELANRVQQVFVKALGKDRTLDVEPVMGGEDFGRYGRTEEEVPIFMFWLGTVAKEQMAAAERGQLQLPSLHNSGFAPDPEPTITTGVVAMTAAVLNLLQ